MGVSGEMGDGYCLFKEKMELVPDLRQLMRKMAKKWQTEQTTFQHYMGLSVNKSLVRPHNMLRMILRSVTNI